MTTHTAARPQTGADITSAPARGPRSAVRAGRTPRRPSHGSFEAARRRLFWPFVLPALILFTVLMLIPLIGTSWISLQNWPGAGPMEWVGLKNYLYLVRDPAFLKSFTNSGLVVLVAGAGVFAGSFILLALMKDMIGRGRAFARAVVFFPVIIPGIVLSIVWGFLFQADGLVNEVLTSVGVSDPPAWLSQENRFGVILLGIIWFSTGFYATVLLAGADQIPPYLYEDCALAGANMWQRFRYVTLPLSWDVITVCAVLWTINALKTFEFILAIAGSSSGLPDPATWTIALYTYASVFNPAGIPSYGRGAASALVMLALIGVLVVLIRRIMRRESIEM